MEDIIKDYTAYLKTNTNAEVSSLEETIENILMRLEEYKGTLDMIKTERVEIENSYEIVKSMKRDIIDLVQRIDAMEVFISRVHQDMNTLETQLIEADQDFPDKQENPLKNLLKPIFSKISPEVSNETNSSGSGMSNATVSSYEKVNIINTEELFKTK